MKGRSIEVGVLDIGARPGLPGVQPRDGRLYRRHVLPSTSSRAIPCASGRPPRKPGPDGPDEARCSFRGIVLADSFFERRASFRGNDRGFLGSTLRPDGRGRVFEGFYEVGDLSSRTCVACLVW